MLLEQGKESMKPVILTLVLLLFGLQYKLWIADGSVFDVWQLKKTLEMQGDKNAQLMERNSALHAEVSELKSGQQALEERARSEFGMIRRGEVYYQFSTSA